MSRIKAGQYWMLSKKRVVDIQGACTLHPLPTCTPLGRPRKGVVTVDMFVACMHNDTLTHNSGVSVVKFESIRPQCRRTELSPSCGSFGASSPSSATKKSHGYQQLCSRPRCPAALVSVCIVLLLLLFHQVSNVLKHIVKFYCALHRLVLCPLHVDLLQITGALHGGQ